jgi:hypothetical protein
VFPRKTTYVLTSLAITQTGGRKMTQFEIADDTFMAPMLPGPISILGPNPTLAGADSNNFGASGIDAHLGPTGHGCSSAAANKDAVVVSPGTDANGNSYTSDVASPLKRPSNYTGVSGSTPDVASLPTGTADNWNDPQYLNALLNQMRLEAQNNGTYYNNMAGCTQNCGLPTSYGQVPGSSTGSPQLTFVDGNDASITDGSGILVVTGDATASGLFHWNGMILVIGTGNLTVNGGGGGQINGGLLVAKMQYDANHNLQLGLGTVDFTWNGGGTNFVQWDSCWASNPLSVTNHFYKVISWREVMY